MKFKLLFTFIVSFISVNGQVGIGTPTPDESSILEINSSDKGMLVPRISLTSKTQQLNVNTNNAHALLVFNIGNNLPQGFYYWKSKIEGEEDKGEWIQVGSDSSSLPNFFYMPSVLLPTTAEMATSMANTNIAYNNGVFIVDLYGIFKAQFDSPIRSSNGTATGLQGFVLPRNAYEYHIIYADVTVFPRDEINFITTPEEEGKLTYKVNSDAIIRNGSFMNIVLKVR